jgi:hypothetical protein
MHLVGSAEAARIPAAEVMTAVRNEVDHLGHRWGAFTRRPLPPTPRSLRGASQRRRGGQRRRPTGGPPPKWIPAARTMLG